MPSDQRSRRKPSRIATLDELSFDGSVESVARLGSRCALAVVSLSGLGGRGPIHAAILEDDAEQRCTAWRLDGFPAADELLLIVAADGAPLPRSGTMVIERAGGDVALSPTEVVQAASPLDQFATRHLVTLEPATRMALLESLIGLVAKRASIRDAASDLAALRDALVERQPEAEIHPTADFAAQIDGIWRLDDWSFYIEGWLLDRHARLEQLLLISPEGRITDIADRLSRYRRTDVSEFLGVSSRAEPGFIAFVELPEESALSAGWILQGISGDGVGFEAVTPAVVDDPDQARLTILDDLALEASAGEQLLARQIGPAITRLQERVNATVEVEWVDQHGTPPADPEVSIVIPLYRRTEFVEHQLAQFVLDPAMREADIVYMLDSPQDATHLRPFAGHLFALYGVPFRLACLTANGGYSVVNNLGAGLARGRMLLLLNSDVLPDRPGWLAPMIAAYDANPKVGALSPKLLYEDESIQHAGLYFERSPGEDTWWNEHYYKGLHRSFPAANVARDVPAVTGACLLIGTELFRNLGGLRGMYVRGDYEDSDLCLRLREQGLLSWYLPEVELYHLEGQSYPSREREAASNFNRMLHSDLWRQSLVELEGR